jgi:hypothetical protein
MRLRFGLAVGGEGILDHLVLENENVLVADVPGLVRPVTGSRSLIRGVHGSATARVPAREDKAEAQL